MKLVMEQRVGPVYVDYEQKRDDMTVMEIPSDTVGYVTGKGGVVLRKIEEEWSTLMFFAEKKNGPRSDRDSRRLERLIIFGNE